MTAGRCMPDYTPVDKPDDICLSRHMLIEASAGTGKTYTIENLVVRFLAERQDLSIDNLLVVTFTEKATCELKQRIREKLHQRLAQLDAGPQACRLEDALDSFDSAQIFTIHGFCQNVLVDYAFENGALFRNERIDDRALFESQLREQMRAGWPRRHADHLKDMLGLLQLPRNAPALVDKLLRVASGIYRPQAGDELLPEIKQDSFGDILQRLEQNVADLRTAAGTRFAENFARLNFNATARNSILAKIVLPLVQYLALTDGRRLDLAALAELMDRIRMVHSQQRSGVDCLMPAKWNRGGQNLDVCPELKAVITGLNALQANLQAATHFLEIDTVRHLQAEVSQIKETHGWISFLDMLTQVHQALEAPGGKALCEQLRRRYKVAFVDEFQDTDPIQWRIFKKIFLPTDGAADGILCLIGDPKQAIYGFRGADVYAYLEAREEMHKLAAAGGASLYSLQTNWRSAPGLVASCNRLFAFSGWFAAPDAAGWTDIAYRDAQAAPEGAHLQELSADDSGRSCVTVVDLRSSSGLAAARLDLAAFVGAEIHFLLNEAGMRISAPKDGGRPLDAGDICILVRGKADVPALEQALSARRIPYTYYKKPGLFISPEATGLSLVLDAISDPADTGAVKKALLTPFFGLSPNEVGAYEALAPDSAIRRLLLAWNALAEKRRWPQLFQSLMEDSGLIFREAAAVDWDRQQANRQQIFEALQTEACRRNLDFRSLCALLDSWRRQASGAGEDADIHQIDTDARKVQIMTIHVSKGLEFPVVFLAGGLTRRAPAAGFTVYHRVHSGRRCIRKVVDLAAAGGHARQQREAQEEEQRLFYVALTRARFKLYVPYMPFAGRQTYVGPVPRLLAGALENAFDRGCSSDIPVQWITPQAALRDAESRKTRGAADQTDGTAGKAEIPQPPFPEPDDHRAKKPQMHSFSRLHSALKAPPAGGGFQDIQAPTREDDEAFGTAAVPVDPAERRLPGGAHTGSMLHAIFENIDFGKVGDLTGGQVANAAALLADSSMRTLIDEQMRLHGTPAHFAREVCRLVTGALVCPIPQVAAGFCLADLGPDACRREVAFLYRVSAGPGAAPGVPGCCSYGNGLFMRGFVDLVFRRGGKYYIADWKSNRIEEGYGPEALANSMQQADYHLQYMIYTVAMCRWLAQMSHGRFQPQRDLGGVLYLYLRGMPKEEGIYFVPGSRIGDIGDMEHRIDRRLRRAARRGGV